MDHSKEQVKAVISFGYDVYDKRFHFWNPAIKSSPSNFIKLHANFLGVQPVKEIEMPTCKECDLFMQRYRLAMANYIEQMQKTQAAAQSRGMVNFEKERAHEMQTQKRYIQAQDFWISHQKQHPAVGYAKKVDLKII
jgi:hypothetical protein